jgi:hypothetical protein
VRGESRLGDGGFGRRAQRMSQVHQEPKIVRARLAAFMTSSLLPFLSHTSHPGVPDFEGTTL